MLTTLVLAVLGGAAFSADLLSAFFGSGFTGTALVDADALLLTFSAGCWLALSAGLLSVAAALVGGCALDLLLAVVLFGLAVGVFTSAGVLTVVGFTGAWLAGGVCGTR